MNIDEALLIADALDPTLDGRGSQTALLALSQEVRRQHAEIEALRASLAGTPPIDLSVRPLDPTRAELPNLLRAMAHNLKEFTVARKRRHLMQAAVELEAMNREMESLNSWRTRGRDLMLHDPEMKPRLDNLLAELRAEPEKARKFLAEVGVGPDARSAASGCSPNLAKEKT